MTQRGLTLLLAIASLLANTNGLLAGGRVTMVATPLPGEWRNPFGIEIKDRNVWITTVTDSRVWHIDLDDESTKPSLVAGSGTLGYSGDGGLAIDAALNWPHEVRVDADGNLFVADTRNHVIRRIDGSSQQISTIVGGGVAGFAESKERVLFDQPHSIALLGDRLLIADTKNHRLREWSLTTGVTRTLSGTGAGKRPIDGATMQASNLHGPRATAIDPSAVWLVLREGNSVWRIDSENSTLHHVAGTGRKGHSGDGGPAKQATLRGPKGIASDGRGTLYVVDTENHVVRKISNAASSSPSIQTVDLIDEDG
ncbi:MAG: hypothetical protein AAGD07_21125, partial [Planctomycetota bacterium]